MTRGLYQAELKHTFRLALPLLVVLFQIRYLEAKLDRPVTLQNNLDDVDADEDLRPIVTGPAAKNYQDDRGNAGMYEDFNDDVSNARTRGPLVASGPKENDYIGEETHKSNIYCSYHIMSIPEAFKTSYDNQTVEMCDRHMLCQYAPCKPPDACGKSRPLKNNNNFRKRIMHLFNMQRKMVAMGEEPAHPTNASDMNFLNYDLEMEFMAQCSASQCQRFPQSYPCSYTIQHGEDYEFVGQAVQGFWQERTKDSAVYDSKEILEKIVKCWTKQKQYLSQEDIASAPKIIKAMDYMQLIWAESKAFGCGRYLVKINETHNYFIIYCNFVPGRIPGKGPIYREGPSCSGCKICNLEYPGLCGESKEVNFFMPPFKMWDPDDDGDGGNGDNEDGSDGSSDSKGKYLWQHAVGPSTAPRVTVGNWKKGNIYTRSLAFLVYIILITQPKF